MARKVESVVVNQQNFRPRKATVSIFAGVFHQLCPRCRMGSIFRSSIFRGYPSMRERCPVCRLKFEREQGYFLGAMYISYGLALLIMALFATGLWAVTGWRLEKLAVASLVPFVPLTPTISRLSRILWIYLDQSLDPDTSS